MNAVILRFRTLTPLSVIVFALGCFALLPAAQAVLPAPDGGYPGGNTAEGLDALLNLSTGTHNTAVGLFALSSNTTGNFNTATGAGALRFNTANNNTATGAKALFSNRTGDRNTADGTFALFHNTRGDSNTAQGFEALLQNTTGARNTASGRETLFSNTTGFENTATGGVAMQMNTTGTDNTATGFAALSHNLAGKANTADGTGSLAFSTGGDLNVALGFGAGAFLAPAGNNNIYVGNVGNMATPSEDNIIRIGAQVAVTDPFGILHPVHTATYIAGIRDADAAGGDAVFVTTDGKLGTVSVLSSARFKEGLRPMDQASEVILSLKPVTFRYKKELDPNGLSQFGLVAEDVEKIAPELVKRDRNGRLQTVRYDAVNAMLLNEFLKEHKKVEQQQTVISQLQSMVAKQETNAALQQKQIDALTAGLQKVSAQLELKESAPQTVLK